MSSAHKFLRIGIPVLAVTLIAVVGLWIFFPGADEPASRKVHFSGAMKALDLWASQRAYPGDDIPALGHAAAYRALQGMERDSGVDIATEPWESIGPANIGGRTLCLALHPNDPDVMFAGSASGGLWKSTTGGEGADAWDHVETGQPVLGVASILIDPDDPDIMFIGTGEAYSYGVSDGGEVDRLTRGSYGIGILKSLDGGLSWEPSLDWSYHQNRGVWMIRFDPTDTSILYAATTEGIYKSTNGGDDWVLSLDVIMATDVLVNPEQTDIIFAGCGNFGSTGFGIYRSLNGGDSWTRLTSGLPASWTGKLQLAISPDGVYASVANWNSGYGLYKSTNLGDSWSRINSSNYASYQGWYSHYVLVSPHDPQRLFTGGIEIWRSENGGNTLSQRSQWTQIYYGTPPPEGPNGGPQYAHADHHFAVWHPTDPDVIFFCSDGGVFKTENFGDTFHCLIGGYLTTQFYNGFSQSGSSPDRAIGGMQDNLSAIYDGNTAWRRVIGGDGCWAAVNQLDDDVMYGSWQGLNMQRSRNGGNNWSGASPPTMSGDVTAFVAPFVLSPSDPDVIYAGRSRVYRSDNEGDNWTATNGGDHLSPGNPVVAMAMSWSSPDTVYASTSPVTDRARVFRTIDGGGVWEDITGDLPDRWYSDLTVDPSDSRVVYVTLMGFGSSHVFRSDDAGLSWTDIGAGLPDVPTSAVVVDPDHPEIVYVGGDLGVFVTPDTGASWEPFVSGMPLTMINDLKIFRPTRMLRTATHGNGVFERNLWNGDLTAVPTFAGRFGLRVSPNPLAADSRVRFTLPAAGNVSLNLYDVRGRRVSRLTTGFRETGEHSVPLSSSGLSSGVYFLRLETSAGSENARVIFVR